MRGYIPPADDDERLFVRRLGDLVQVVRQRGTSRSTPFLSDRQQELARAALAGLGFEGYAFDGGYPDAERRILRLFGEYGAQEPLPAVCLFAQTLRADRALTHRDYLGALMSLGIRRECIGDILLSEDGAYLFVLDTVAPLVCDELSSGALQRVARGRAEELPGREERPAQTATVASLRLDAVLAASCISAVGMRCSL
ncbi:MAG: YlmH/Sll1252 family protein [Ruthenibacterium lactatiformans]